MKLKKMHPSFSIFWLFSGVVLIFLALVPQFSEWVSYKLGFATPSNMIFVLTIFMAFYLIFNLTIAVSKETQKNVTLVQEISILKKKIAQIENKIDSK